MCKEVVGAACYDFMRTGFDTLVTTPLDMSLNTTPCVSCGRCAETCPTGALMPKPRVLEKYEVDESRCILCGICVDACPYDALRCGPDFELSHESRAEPMIDLLATSFDRPRHRDDSSVRKERDWLERASEQGRDLDPGRMLPMLPAGVAQRQSGNGHSGNGHVGQRPRRRLACRARPRRSRSRRRDHRSAGGRVPLRALMDLGLPPTDPVPQLGVG